MDSKIYWERLTGDQQQDLANRLGISKGYLYQILNRKILKGRIVRASGILAKEIEQETKKRDEGDNSYNGIVFKHKLRSDLFDDPNKVKT